MDAAFLEAWVHRDDHRVLGRRLRPGLCLYDVLALESIGNAAAWFAFSEELRPFGCQPFLTAAELAQVVQVCSMPPGAALKPRFFRRTFRVWRPYQFAVECRKLDAYIEDFCTFPELWMSDEADHRNLNAPWLLGLAVTIEKNSNRTEHEIFSLPLGKLFWLAATLGEQAGAAEILSEEDKKIVAEIRAARSKKSPKVE